MPCASLNPTSISYRTVLSRMARRQEDVLHVIGSLLTNTETQKPKQLGPARKDTADKASAKVSFVATWSGGQLLGKFLLPFLSSWRDAGFAVVRLQFALATMLMSGNHQTDFALAPRYLCLLAPRLLHC